MSARWPTLVGTIYGTNFINMPELRWAYGYPLAMAGTRPILYMLSKRRTRL